MFNKSIIYRFCRHPTIDWNSQIYNITCYIENYINADD